MKGKHTGHTESLDGLMNIKIWINMLWPSQSPHLNSVQQLWEILDRCVRQCSPPSSSKHQMRGYVLEEWSSIPPVVPETWWIKAKELWWCSGCTWWLKSLLKHFQFCFGTIPTYYPYTQSIYYNKAVLVHWICSLIN